MSRRRRRRTYNAFFLFFTLIMVGVAAALSYYVLNENDYFKEYWPESWKTGKKKVSKDSSKEEDIDFDDSSFYSIYKHVSDYTSLRDISHYDDFSSTELLGIIKEDFATSDFKETEEVSDDGLQLYSLDGSIVLTYLQRIFGSDISIDLSSFENCSIVVNSTTGASLGGSGMTLISFDNALNTFKVSFSDIGGDISGYATIIDRKIVKAVKSKNKIVVQDKIIYPSLEINDNRTAFTYKIYADPDHSLQIDSISFTADNVSTGVIDIDEYINKTSTIEYQFRLLKGKYYYQSSKIKKG